MNGSETNKATYTFEEIIDRIAHSEDNETLKLIEEVLREECLRYSLFHIKVIFEAIRIRKELNIQFK